MLARTPMALLLMIVTGFSDLGAQVPPALIVENANVAREPARSLVRADTTFFGYPTALSATDRAHGEALQIEEEEPGSFLLGAIVGAAVTAIWLSQRSEGDGDPLFVYAPIGALMGGMIFWSAGIG